MGTIQERLNVQKQFRELLPEKFKDITLIGNASDFPLKTLESDEYYVELQTSNNRYLFTI
jgi:hypothetical protein